MKLKKIISSTVCAMLALSLAACGGSTSETVTDGSGTEEKQVTLKLGHNLAQDHAAHIALSGFADNVNERTDGSVTIQIFPNGTLGSESDMISQIQTGALDMAKVSAATLGNFSSLYNAYSVPYVFDDLDHYYKVMDGDITQEIFNSTADDGFVGLTWLDSGSRSFYTVDKPIRVPEDMKGLKIRTMDSEMSIKMMDNLGGSAVVMGYGDIYTGLQQGVIDGAENNVTALRDHGEVAKFYSFDEHTRIPDVVIISTKTWNTLSENQKDIILECAKEMTEQYKTDWVDFENQVLDKAVNEFGVELVYDVNKGAFQTAVQPIYEGLKVNDPEVYEIVEEIRAEAE